MIALGKDNPIVISQKDKFIDSTIQNTTSVSQLSKLHPDALKPGTHRGTSRRELPMPKVKLSYTRNLRGIAFKRDILWYFDFSTN